jgi:cytochrome c biogenesis protein CcdA
VDREVLGLAFAAGLVAALNPCGFALLPAYLALVVRGEGDRRSAGAALGRAATATVAMAIGFVAVFGAFGALTIATAATVQRSLPYATIAIGVSFVALGLWLLLGRELRLRAPTPHRRLAPSARLGSMFGYGVSYAVASLSCTIGPFLAVTGAALRSGALRMALVYAVYAAGFTLVVGALAIGTALASSAVSDRLRRIMPYVNRIGGALLMIVGLYVAYYGVFEVRLFSATGGADDPVITAAGRLQGAVAGWVHRHGAWPWLVLLAAVLGVVILTRVSAAARPRRADPATAGDESSPVRPETPTPDRR